MWNTPISFSAYSHRNGTAGLGPLKRLLTLATSSSRLEAGRLPRVTHLGRLGDRGPSANKPSLSASGPLLTLLPVPANGPWAAAATGLSRPGFPAALLRGCRRACPQQPCKAASRNKRVSPPQSERPRHLRTANKHIKQAGCFHEHPLC